jgi:hypothetical protein
MKLNQFKDLKIGDEVFINSMGLALIGKTDDREYHQPFQIETIHIGDICEENNYECTCNTFFNLKGVPKSNFVYEELDKKD